MHPSDHYFEDSFAHAELHASRIRIVPREQLDEATAEFKILFPHEPVHVAPMGCPHLCLYTDEAPASLIDERIGEHLREVEHRPPIH